MKYKGIDRNVPKSEMPEGFGVDAKNGVNSNYLGGATNEGGFKPHQKTGTSSSAKYGIPVTISGTTYHRQTIGEIVIDAESVIICSIGFHEFVAGNPTTTVFSEIGIVDEEGLYTVIINDFSFSLANKLNFSAAYPITGEFSRNYLNERIVALTDNNNKPFYINIDYWLTNGTGGFTLNQILMFPEYNQVNVSTTVNDSGGTIPSCAMYLAFRYKNKDLSVTNTTLPSNPVYIYNQLSGSTLASIDLVQGDLETVITNKSVSVVLTNVNTSFDSIEILALVKQVGVNKAYIVKTVTISSSTVNFIVSGLGDTEISVAEFLTPKAIFTKVYKFTQIYSRLYAASPTISSIRNYQRYANLINIKWRSNILSPDAIDPQYRDVGRTFLHKEVYAFYIHLELTDGSVTEGFHIPWNRLDDAAITSAGYRDASTLASSQGLAMKKFQIEDTTLISSANIGHMGFWENEDEYYPNTDDYDSTSLGGQNLKGKKVRHHRFPSIAWCKDNLYSTNDLYGLNHLDKLGIDINNVIIPTELLPFVKAWFISFAERTYDNSTVIGQSTVQFQATTTESVAGI